MVQQNLPLIPDRTELVMAMRNQREFFFSWSFKGLKLTGRTSRLVHSYTASMTALAAYDLTAVH